MIADAPHPDQLLKRIAELESEVAQLSTARQKDRAQVRDLLAQLVPYEPVTAAELHDMTHGPRGTPITVLIAECESEVGAR